MTKLLISALAGAAALVVSGTAAAGAPAVQDSTFHLGPLVDTDTCAFPITLTVDRTRRITTFDNGDATRHVALTVVQTANGHTAVESDTWNVFIPGDDPTSWKMTGRFTQVFLDGRLISLESGLLGFDALTGEVSDPHPGPLGAYPDPCTILAGS